MVTDLTLTAIIMLLILLAVWPILLPPLKIKNKEVHETMELKECCEQYYKTLLYQQTGKAIKPSYCPICGQDLNVLRKKEDEEKRLDNNLLKSLTDKVHQNAAKHGWWDEKRSFGDLIALCHAELSEALEEFRDGRKPYESYFKCARYDNIMHCPIKKCDTCTQHKPEGIPIELADVVIRILDICGYYNIDLYKAITTKMNFNEARPYKHGGKVL